MTYPWTWPLQLLIVRLVRAYQLIMSATLDRESFHQSLADSSPLDCPFVLRNNRWYCPLCGFRTKRGQFSVRPRKNCPKRLRQPDRECVHLGDPTGEHHECKGCGGSLRVHAIFACEIHGKCLPVTRLRESPFPQCLAGCQEYRTE